MGTLRCPSRPARYHPLSRGPVPITVLLTVHVYTMEKAFYKTAAWTEFSKAKLVCTTALEHMRAAAANPALPVDDLQHITTEARDALRRLNRARAGLAPATETAPC
jgi:hypothetical protein